MSAKITAQEIVGHLNDILDGKAQPYGNWNFCLNLAMNLVEQEPDNEELTGLIWQVIWYEVLPRWQDEEIDLQQTILSLELITKHPNCFALRLVTTSQALLAQMLAELLDEQPFPVAPHADETENSGAVAPDKVWQELYSASQKLAESDEVFIGQEGEWSCYLSPQDKAHSDLPAAFKIKIVGANRHYAVLIWSTGRQRPLIISDQKFLDNLVDLCDLAIKVANNYLLKGLAP